MQRPPRAGTGGRAAPVRPHCPALPQLRSRPRRGQPGHLSSPPSAQGSPPHGSRTAASGRRRAARPGPRARRPSPSPPFPRRPPPPAAGAAARAACGAAPAPGRCPRPRSAPGTPRGSAPPAASSRCGTPARYTRVVTAARGGAAGRAGPYRTCLRRSRCSSCCRISARAAAFRSERLRLPPAAIAPEAPRFRCPPPPPPRRFR